MPASAATGTRTLGVEADRLMVVGAALLTDDLRLRDDRAGASGDMLGCEDSGPVVFWSSRGGWEGEGKISGALALACCERNGGLDADAGADAGAEADAMTMTLSDVRMPIPVPVPVSAPVAASVSRTREPFFSFSLSLFPAAIEMEVIIRSVRLDPSAPSVSGLLPYTRLEIEIETGKHKIDPCTALLYVAIECRMQMHQNNEVAKQNNASITLSEGCKLPSTDTVVNAKVKG